MEKITYKCDLCDWELDRGSGAYEAMVGIRFTAGKNFVIDTVNTTRGKHICKECLCLLKSQIEEKWELIKPKDSQCPSKP